MSNLTSPLTEAVAIVGLAGRFPQARNVDEFWRNLRGGTESVSFFSDDQVQWLPIEHPPVLTDPRYVKARALLERPEWFDAAFFGLNPREASIMDPQHRVFLECAWEALEDAGCNPDAYPGLIGVFAGASMNTYLFMNLLTNPSLVKDYGLFSAMIMNNPDFVPTRVSYKLNLRGPSINVQTACSTSLVAVCLAAQNLLSYRCDMALAGGVSINFPPYRGQHHLEGAIHSHDGHCRAFDASASGTVLGDGAGIVVLKRLSEAMAEGDRIYAVIKGTGINNDGAVKIGYTAPSIDGQAECIAMAQAEAGVEPESISYVEAHGTGTPLGDPIEIAGLCKGFGVNPEKTAPGAMAKTCVLGSVKSNIGHLDVAAGVAGLIKTVLALQHEELPPSLHFQSPNPKLQLERTPFLINHELRPWPRGDQPRRAGVSSFGIGGTNAHVVLEEASAPAPSQPSTRSQHLLVLSAKTPAALDVATANLADHLRNHPEQDIADVSFSLQTRRKGFEHRRFVVAGTREAAVSALENDARALATGSASATPSVAFMFPGQGAQSVNMARELYFNEPRFRSTVDRCCELLKPKLGLDLRDVLYPTCNTERVSATAVAVGTVSGPDCDVPRNSASDLLSQTRYTQPALFVVEYALADLLMHLGVRPDAMIGHSLGEYVAACVAGVFSLEDALEIIAERARLMQAQPEGAMLAIRLPEERVVTFLDSNLSLAATNARGLCVVSGPFDAITVLEKKLGESGVASRRLATSHAFHSAMMDAAARPLSEFIARFSRQAPTIPFVSNVTGKWITPEQAKDPSYWASHLRQTVRFADGVALLAEIGAKRVLVEVGPGETLAGLARQEPATSSRGVAIFSSLPRRKEGGSDFATFLQMLGHLWTAGAPIIWKSLYSGETRRFVPLPTYPFERKRHWIEPGVSFDLSGTGSNGTPAIAATAASHPDAVPSAGSGESASSGAATPAVCPPTTLAKLRGLFSELSGIDFTTSSAEASFFQLGFDSLFLTQASLAVTRQFGVDVTFRQLRDQLTTFEKLSSYLDGDDRLRSPGPTREGANDQRSAVTVEATAAPAVSVVPLSDAQRELWFASQLGSEVSSAYNESANIHLEGALDLDALNRAFTRLLARHEALRATITPSGEEQIISTERRLSLGLRDFASSELESRDRLVREFIDAEVERPFNLVDGPLCRAHLLRLEAQRHIIVLIVHHIICDGWSLGILQKDLGELYTEEVKRAAAGIRLSTPDTDSCSSGTPSFSEYVAAQATMHATPAFRAAEEYWLKQFSDEVPVLELPGDRPRSVERRFAGAFMLRDLSPELTAALRELGAKHDCTLFTVLLAAFNVLVHRLSGQQDLVIGIPAAAQVMDGVDDLVGHFANLLPVRNRVDDQQAFAEFLGQVRARLFDALEHWRYPFGRLLHNLNVARDSSRMPLANVVFNSTRLRGTVPFGPMVGEVDGNAKRFSHFDLNFNFALTGDVISLGAYYSTELFDAATVARWFTHFETLLGAIVQSPAARLCELPLLTSGEREEIVHGWNDRSLPYDREATVASMFEAQARRTPDAVALVGGLERMTYRELDARAGRLADRLRAAGVGAETRVGIFLERTPQLVIAILGIVKAGGAYVPLDPRYPAERLEFIVSDARVPLIVTQASLVAHLPTGEFDFLTIDDDALGASRPGRSPKAGVHLAPNSRSLAYVIYTSGSTGRPKGVPIEQRCVVAHVAWARSVFSDEELGGMLFSTSASFDVSVFELFCPLCLGGKIILAEDILQLGSLPAANEVRLVSGVPSAVAEVLRLGLLPPSVTTLSLAGENVPQGLVDALYALPHVRRVFDHYGPTETTVYSAGGLRHRNSKATIGRPFPNERIYILDYNRQPVPVGVSGEMYIGGDKLARGYLNRPDLTAAKFVPNPFSGAPEARMYRTGDLARWLPDGTIELIGRTDHQVKIRGFRIELGEVEAVLARHPAVAECVVVARPDAGGYKRLLAYALLRPGVKADPRELREHLQRALPDYMVPSALQILARWPLTPNGKLDRKALPDPEQPAMNSDYTPPGTTTEELLAEMWCDVLGLDRVGIHDNFFELGGHSLLATQVIARVHDTLEVELSIRQFFGAPTVAALAVMIEAALIREIKTMADPGGTSPFPGACVSVEDKS